MLSADPQTCRASAWQPFTVYLNRAGAGVSRGNFYILLHSGRICHLGGRIMKQCFFSGPFRHSFPRRHGNGWIGLNELSSLSVRVRSMEHLGFVLSCQGIKWIWFKLNKGKKGVCVNMLTSDSFRLPLLRVMPFQQWSSPLLYLLQSLNISNYSRRLTQRNLRLENLRFWGVFIFCNLGKVKNKVPDLHKIITTPHTNYLK